MTRTVVVLFGPPGAGKSAAAERSELAVLDRYARAEWRDSDAQFRRAIAGVHMDEQAAAVVIRPGKTGSARLRDLVAARATHAWVMLTPPEVCRGRVRALGRPWPPLRQQYAEVGQWWREWDHGSDVPVWPGAWPDLSVPTQVTELMARLQPPCPRCRARHRPDLPCWWSRYAEQISTHVLTVQGRTCWICGATATTADHITARAFGGDDGLDNLRPACRRCNGGRGAKANPFTTNTPASHERATTISTRWQ